MLLNFVTFFCYKAFSKLSCISVEDTSSTKKIELEVAGQTLDCYCVCCELLSASIADALWFVNMVCLPLIAEQNAHEICLTQECLQIVRRLLWKRTTTHSLRNNNPMFDGNLWPNSFEQPSTHTSEHNAYLEILAVISVTAAQRSRLSILRRSSSEVIKWPNLCCNFSKCAIDNQ